MYICNITTSELGLVHKVQYNTLSLYLYIIKICIHYYDVCFISVSPFYFDDIRESFIHVCHDVLSI